MEGNIYITGLIGAMEFEQGVELIDIISQVKKQPLATSFNVYINSEGGVVDTGFDIYNYLKSLGLPIKTIGSGMVASIATVVFMAGDTRVLRDNTQFMIHLPMGGIESATADDIENYAKEVRNVEDKLIKFYSENIGLDKEAIKPLLKNETWLNNIQSLELGFSNAQDLPMVAKAYLKTNINNKLDMTTEDKNWIESIFAKFIPAKKAIVNITVTDANGVVIDFADVADGLEPIDGDVGTIEGKPAEGDFVMPNGDTYSFVAGVLTITTAVVDEQAEMANLKAENESLKAQIATALQGQEAKELELTALKTEVVNIKKQVTSRFEADDKKDAPKEKEVVNLSPAQIALNNIKNKKK